MIRVDEQRLGLSVERLARFSRPDPDPHAVSRLPWTAEDREALDWIRAVMESSGLKTSVDPLGNLWGLWDVGADTSIVVGSHRDSVPKGGAFDGALGVLAALEVLATLRRTGYHPRHNIELVAWNDEEGARFGTTLFGSRLYVGALRAEDVRDLTDADGITLADAARQAGFQPERMRATSRLSRIHAYLELHIEQGPILEREGRQIGIVTGVGGIIQRRVTLRGARTHAAYSGSDRHDPVLAAAEGLQQLATLVTRANRDARHAALGVTVGRLQLSSALINVVPEAVSFTVDGRAPDPQRVLDTLAEFEAELGAAAAARGVDLTVEAVNDHTTLAGGGRVADPVLFHPELRGMIRAAAADLHYSTLEMFSWAGHDAMALAPRVPTAMIFVPSERGLSHSPAEHTRTDDAARGANVLLNTLAAVDAADGIRRPDQPPAR